MRYFQQFPVINYNDVLVRNITARVKVLESAKNNATVYYNYTIKEGEQIDAIAYNYYGSPYYFWVIALVNEMTDLYFDWPLDQDDFEKYLSKKYGSLNLATSTILHYKKNATTYYLGLRDNSILSEAQFQALTIGQQSLYEPTAVLSPTIISVATYEALEENADDFSPVYADQYEFEKNEEKRHIKLLDLKYLSLIEDNLKELLKQNAIS